MADYHKMDIIWAYFCLKTLGPIFLTMNYFPKIKNGPNSSKSTLNFSILIPKPKSLKPDANPFPPFLIPFNCLPANNVYFWFYFCHVQLPFSVLVLGSKGEENSSLTYD